MAADATIPTPAGPRPPRRRLQVLLTVVLMLLVGGVSAGAAWLLRGARVSAARSDADLVSRGRMVYAASCQSCHGAEGRGDGPSAASLHPPPRDLTAGAWKCGTDPGAVRHAIADGIRGTAMPGSRAALSSGDLDAVTAYVLTLAPRGEAREQPSAELQTLLQQAGLTPADSLRAAPPLALCDISGRSLKLADLRGRMVLVQFWETTCIPCVKKLPSLGRLAEAYRDRGLVVLPVCLDVGDAAHLHDWTDRRAAGLSLYADVRGSARAEYDVSALPAVALIDRDGRLVARGAGPADWGSEEARALLDAYLAP